MKLFLLFLRKLSPTELFPIPYSYFLDSNMGEEEEIVKASGISNEVVGVLPCPASMLDNASLHDVLPSNDIKDFAVSNSPGTGNLVALQNSSFAPIKLSPSSSKAKHTVKPQKNVNCYEHIRPPAAYRAPPPLVEPTIVSSPNASPTSISGR